MKIKLDLTGQKFGRLMVIEKAEKPPHSRDRHSYWLCRCECGNISRVAADKLKNGSTRSCGCLKAELDTERIKTYGKPNLKHGLCNSRIYNIYNHMISRCYKKNDRKYKDYGGRGITVCSEWRDSFQRFCDWAMANGYTDELSIDRIDNNNGYSPDNCRWATFKQQANNKRTNKTVTIKGETMTIAQAAEKAGVSTQTMWWRVENGKRGEELLERRIKRSAKAV